MHVSAKAGRVTYDQLSQMPISGATLNVICPTCGAAFDVELEDAEPRETPHQLLHRRVSYRCPACEHLGEVQVHLEEHSS